MANANVKGIDMDELMEDMEDVMGKLQSIIADVKGGRELDATQKGFLKAYNIL